MRSVAVRWRCAGCAPWAGPQWRPGRLQAAPRAWPAGSVPAARPSRVSSSATAAFTSLRAARPDTDNASLAACSASALPRRRASSASASAFIAAKRDSARPISRNRARSPPSHSSDTSTASTRAEVLGPLSCDPDPLPFCIRTNVREGCHIHGSISGEEIRDAIDEVRTAFGSLAPVSKRAGSARDAPVTTRLRCTSSHYAVARNVRERLR